MLFTSSFWNINLLAVLMAGIAHMLTGLVWFLPGLFGNDWVKLTGKDLKPASQWLFVGVLGHLCIAFVLAFLINLAGTTTLMGGIAVGVLIWAGFIVTLEIGELIWEKIPFRLFLLRIGNHLVALSIAGAILAVWR
jgi:hypothetical protein